jgi:hypothetical protein
VDPATFAAVLAKVIDMSQPEWKRTQQGLRHRLQEEVPRAVGEHHVGVVQWCQEVHTTTFGPLLTDAPTVELAFGQVPRRLGLGGNELDELDVLVEPSHMVVLGDLGSGKTTTLRRLARAVALEPSTSPNDNWQFVVLVVCREESWDKVGLYDVVGRAVGITGRLYSELDNPQSRIRQVLEAGCLVLIDGLDEVPRRHRADLERDIVQLGRHLRTSKVIVSCRSADYAAPLPGFETAEIRPLGPDQIKKLVQGVLGDDEAPAFYAALVEHPAGELADRPLFLTYLAAIYKRRGIIPDRPAEIYEAIVRLVIQDWDEQRGVRRASKWAGFGVDEKRHFLADLAYELTRQESFRFEERQLIDIYEGLADRYDLPKAQARMVARELESHTGLLTQVGDYYQFSHLALQEYLAADALVRAPASARSKWWESFPVVAAITVAMSSDPNRWLHDLTTAMPANLGGLEPVQPFLDRLGQERPRFSRSEQLGDDLLRLAARAHAATPNTFRLSDITAVTRLGSLKPVRDSVADALSLYALLDVGIATTRASKSVRYPSRPSNSLVVPTSWLNALMGEERLRQLVREMSAASARNRRAT